MLRRHRSHSPTIALDSPFSRAVKATDSEELPEAANQPKSPDVAWWTDKKAPELVVGAVASRWSYRRILLENPVVPLFVVAAGTSLLRWTTNFLSKIVGSTSIDGLITGAFMPSIGILFAMMTSTAVVTLRQRQQDCRDLINLELSSIRLLVSMISDITIAGLLLEYTRTVDAETFSHRANGIVYHQHGYLSCEESDGRENLFAYADEILYELMRTVNSMRLRGEIEVEMRELVRLRSRRRATLDTGFPLQYFGIVFALGGSIVLSFLLILIGNPSWIECTFLRLSFNFYLSLPSSFLLEVLLRLDTVMFALTTNSDNE